MYCPSDSEADHYNLNVEFMKQGETTVSGIELVLIKEENEEIKESICEPTIKQEPLHWDEPESVHDTKVCNRDDMIYENIH